MTSTITPSPTMAPRRRTNRRQARRLGLSIRIASSWPGSPGGRIGAVERRTTSSSISRASASGAASVLIAARSSAQPRVDQDVAEVGEEVQGDVGGRGDEHHTLDDGVVAVEHGVYDKLAEARDGEDLLGQHRAREKRAELERAERDDRRQRVAHR